MADPIQLAQLIGLALICVGALGMLGRAWRAEHHFGLKSILGLSTFGVFGVLVYLVVQILRVVMGGAHG